MIRTLRTGWLSLFILVCMVSAAAQNSTQDLLMRADKQFDLYAYNLAMRTYESVLKQEPANAHALARVADCYFQLNKPEDALPYYEKAVAQPKSDAEVMFRYGKVLMQTGDYVGARKWFNFYAEGKPEVGQHYANMCDYAMKASGKQSMYEVRNEPLNTVAADFGPTFYQNKLVYNSARNDIKRERAAKTSQDWTGSAYNQLFLSAISGPDNYLQKPGFLKGDLENNYNEGPASFSADGSIVAFCRNNFIDGTRQVVSKGINMSLYTAEVINGKWVNEKSFPYNGSDFATGFPCLSPDGNTLYFASNQPSGFGGWDIYVSTRTAAGWSQPRNLGAPLNTPGNEVTPYLEGNSLYFSSDWHQGLGGQDVFRAEMNGLVVNNIFHLGPGINSTRDDYGFVFDSNKNRGYFTSNRPQGRGNEDIWHVKKTIEEYSILVQDNAQQPLFMADIDFTGCGGGVQQTDAAGMYGFAVRSGKTNCQVTVRKNGYVSANATVSSEGDRNLVVTLRAIDNPTASDGVVFDASTSPSGTALVDYYTLLVTDPALRPLYFVEVDMRDCGLGVFRTDQNGKVKFQMSSDVSCMVSLNKEGYEAVLFPVEANASKQFIVAMNPIGAQPDPAKNAVLSEPITYSTVSPPTNNSTLITPNTIKPPSTANTSQRVGYAIQLAAGPGAMSNAKMQRYSQLAPHGNIYSTTEKGLNKVRLGVYTNREDAKAKLPEVKKVVPDAFVVMERGADNELFLDNENLQPAEYGYDPPLPASVQPKSVEPGAVLFAVQVASLSNTDPYVLDRFGGLSDIGNVYAKPEGGRQKVRIGVWADHAQAEQAKKQLAELGFSDAIVVTEKGSDANMQQLLISTN